MPLVLVKVGAVPPDHLIAAPHVTALAVPSAVSSRVKLAAELAGVLLIVRVVIAALSETAKKLLPERSKVSVPLEIVGAVLVSRYACNLGWVSRLPPRFCVPVKVFVLSLTSEIRNPFASRLTPVPSLTPPKTDTDAAGNVYEYVELITPLEIVMDVPSTLTPPRTVVVAVGRV